MCEAKPHSFCFFFFFCSFILSSSIVSCLLMGLKSVIGVFLRHFGHVTK